MLDPSRTGEPPAVDVVVGIPTVPPDGGGARRSALAAEGVLRQAFPDRPTLAVVLDGAAPHAEERDHPAVVYTGGHGGPDAALPALLELAVSRGAPACALLEPLPRPADPGWLRALLQPVLDEHYDLVAPSYARGRFEGVLVTGIVYPLTRRSSATGCASRSAASSCSPGGSASTCSPRWTGAPTPGTRAPTSGW
ncbi:MAG: hypothetical protein QM704_13740 [Anaeromyxobacteraceae bacterium]